jgi:hypothetical protein
MAYFKVLSCELPAVQPEASVIIAGTRYFLNVCQTCSHCDNHFVVPVCFIGGSKKNCWCVTVSHVDLLVCSE